ncbi:arginase [Desulforhopalus singaporensis]|uniref:Arginase n=2 Tax=Desulforhopalus singaporensis TaxID=91360 RepID=A0A1H0R0S9_9BACT|nr:arginase [Desulforhopalus singaporensis]
MDLGQSHRGVDMGPSAVRYADLASNLTALGYSCRDSGNITIPGRYELSGTSLRERLPLICEGCRSAYKLGKESIEAGEIPIFLGGDHSSSVGTVGGVTDNSEVGLLWIDAHGDFNTPETSDSQNVHGMALAVLLGLGPEELVNVGRKGPKVKPENVVLIGQRELDDQEKKLIRDSGVTIYTMRDVDEFGIRQVVLRTLDKLGSLDKLHVSLDLDVMDPLDAPGVGTPSQGGLTYREGQLVMEMLADTGKLHSVDIMEINPILDIQNRTAQMAVNLVSSLFGKKII